MSTKQPISGSAVKNNGGTIVNAGNNSFNSVGQSDLNVRPEFIDVVTTNAKKSITAGDFGNIHLGSYIILGHTTTIAGVANTSIAGLGSLKPAANALNYGKGAYRRHITDISWLTGAAAYGGNAGDQFTYIAASDGGAIDQEAEPTRNIPGKFVYNMDSTVTLDAYPAKSN